MSACPRSLALRAFSRSKKSLHLALQRFSWTACWKPSAPFVSVPVKPLPLGPPPPISDRYVSFVEIFMKSRVAFADAGVGGDVFSGKVPTKAGRNPFADVSCLPYGRPTAWRAVCPSKLLGRHTPTPPCASLGAWCSVRYSVGWCTCWIRTTPMTLRGLVATTGPPPCTTARTPCLEP